MTQSTAPTPQDMPIVATYATVPSIPSNIKSLLSDVSGAGTPAVRARCSTSPLAAVPKYSYRDRKRHKQNADDMTVVGGKSALCTETCISEVAISQGHRNCRYPSAYLLS